MNDALDFLTQTAAPKVLVRLLEGPHYMTQLYRGVRYPDGIASQQAITAARNVLLNYDMIESFFGNETPRARMYLRLTERGRTVAEHLKAIQDLLDQTP